MSENRKNVGGRGSSWREKEILDLLSFWGEEKIQEALRSSHRNFDCFVKVAEQMAKRGHRRSALECRSKSKTMRLEYKRVVAHNNRSGNAPTTCPYFKELDSILRGDASVRPKRVARSMVLQVVGENSRESLDLRDGSEELFSHEMLEVGNVGNWTSTPTEEDGDDGTSGALRSSQESDATLDGLDNSVSGSSHSSFPGENPNFEKENLPPRDSNVEKGSSDKPLAEQSPGSRLANIRARRRKTAGLYCVADKLMSHSSEEQQSELEERRKEQQEAREWHGDYMRENREERALFQEALTQNMDILRSAVSALNQLGEALLHQQRAVIPQAEAATTEAQPDRPPLPRRACVGKRRDRLTM